MREIKIPQLCDDTNLLVWQHVHAMRIQARARARVMRHARLPGWRLLRHILTQALPGHSFDCLQRNAMVRREWRDEIESWLHTAVFGVSDITVIVNELVLWR